MPGPSDPSPAQTRNPLPAPVRRRVIALLAPCLADALDLQQQIKHAHWNVRGASFIALHELFDEVWKSTYEHADLIAERIAQLGGSPGGRLADAARLSKLPRYPKDLAEGGAHARALAAVMGIFGGRVRGAIEKADEAGDPVTADILTDVARGTDESLWKIEAHVPA